MKRDKGFTVLELMVTIVIFCVLLGLAIPGFANWIPKYRLRSAARDLYSNLQLAKMTAVKDRANCGIMFDAANSRYLVVDSGANRSFESSAGAVAGDDAVLRSVSFSEYGSGVAYGHGSATGSVDGAGFDNEITFQDDGVVFDTRGMILRPSGAASTGGYVYLKNSNNSAFAVGVLGGGVIVLQRWTGSAWQQ